MATDFDDHGSSIAETTARVSIGRACGSSACSWKTASAASATCCVILRSTICESWRLCIIDSHDSAVARIMLSSYDRGREILSLSGFAYFESDIIGVALPVGHQPFVTLCSSLLQAEVNIQYTYPLMCRPDGRSAIAISVDDIEMAIKVLAEHGHRLVTEDDLLADD